MGASGSVAPGPSVRKTGIGLGAITTERGYTIRGLTDSNEMTWTYRGRGRIRRFSRDSIAFDEITKAVETKQLLLLVSAIIWRNAS